MKYENHPITQIEGLKFVLKSGKKSIEKEWNTKNNYYFNSPEIQTHIKEGKEIALLTDQKIIVIDIDNKNNPKFQEIETHIKDNFPETIWEKTPSNGWHIYLKCDNFGQKKDYYDENNNLIIEILSNGHSSNLYLKEIKGNHISHVDKEFILEKLAKYETNKTKTQTQKIENILTGTPKGNRNSSAFTLANALIKQGCDTKTVYQTLTTWNKNNNPPLPEKELTTIIQSAEKRKKTKKNPNKYYENGHFQPHLLVKEILEENNIITMFDNEGVYYYENGIYEENGLNYIKKQVLEKIGENLYREVTHYKPVQELIKPSTYIRREEIEKTTEKLLCLENGILNIETKEFTPHTHEKIFFTKIPIKYNKNQECPSIKKFLKEITKAEDSQILQEIAGYCLLKDYPIQKAIMLTGTGENGKTKYLELIEKFLGKPNVTNKSIQELQYNRFAKADLYQKLANIYADLSKKSLDDTGTFKMLTGGDYISAEKKHQDAFKFKNHAKLLFSANEFPDVNDETDAFFRRWVLIDFPFKFVNNPEKENEKKKNPFIINEITTEEELTGFLNYAIEGLERILKQNDFSNSQTTQEAKEFYKKKSNPVAAFVNDWGILGHEESIEKGTLYNYFTDYCRNNKTVPLSKQKFGEKLQIEFKVWDAKSGSNRLWKGISIDTSFSVSFKEKEVNLLEDKGQKKLNDVGHLGQMGQHSEQVRKKDSYSGKVWGSSQTSHLSQKNRFVELWNKFAVNGKLDKKVVMRSVLPESFAGVVFPLLEGCLKANWIFEQKEGVFVLTSEGKGLFDG